MKKVIEEMKIIYPHCAAIDVGSRFHMTSIGQSDEEVKKFGVTTSDHQKMIQYFRKNEITHVALESTGSYFQSLLLSLEEVGFEVALVHGGNTKNVSGKKTDVIDCKWIQKIFSLGLLNSCFIPSTSTASIRSLKRHRDNLLDESARLLNRMSQSLRLMNIRLDVAINDLGGTTGQAIISAIVDGERNGNKLASLAHPRIKKSQEELALNLEGRWDENQLYILSDQFSMYKYVRDKIIACDNEMSRCFNQILESQGEEVASNKELTKKKKSRNSTKIDIAAVSYNYYGVDLMEIECVSEATILSLLSELGRDIYKFDTASKFVSWLRLAPNNKKTGGKVVSSRTPKGTNKFTQTLRNAANTISRKKTGYLLHFFQKIAFKKGRGAAITATARKMAVIIWNMITKKQPYKPIDMIVYKQNQRNKSVERINKMIDNMKIKVDELVFGRQRFTAS